MPKVIDRDEWNGPDLIQAFADEVKDGTWKSFIAVGEDGVGNTHSVHYTTPSVGNATRVISLLFHALAGLYQGFANAQDENEAKDRAKETD